MTRTLGDVLSDPDEMPWNEWLLLRREPWTAASACRIESFDELPDDVDLPPAAARDGFTVALDGQSVRSIVDNLLQQASEADLELRLNAFKYYIGQRRLHRRHPARPKLNPWMSPTEPASCLLGQTGTP